MTVIQTYQQGGRHKAGNQACEDRTYSLSKDGVTVIALADGAGNSKYTHSAEGAECVTKTISEFFCNNFDKFYEKKDYGELSAVIMRVCHNALQKKAKELDIDSITRLSSTLLCVAVKEKKAIVCHIGDGVIGKLTPAGTYVISEPDNGEFAGTTFFITGQNADKHIRIKKEELNDTISYFLMSDGTSDYIYDKHDNRFFDAAGKMALMPFEDNGQEMLNETICKYMIEKDNRSDDCSYICLKLDGWDKASIIAATSKYSYEDSDIKAKEANLPTNSEKNDVIEKDKFKKCIDDEKKADDASSESQIIPKRKLFLLIVAALLLFFATLVAAMSRSHHTDNLRTTTITSSTATTQNNTATKKSKPKGSTDNTNATKKKKSQTTLNKEDNKSDSTTVKPTKVTGDTTLSEKPVKRKK